MKLNFSEVEDIVKKCKKTIDNKTLVNDNYETSMDELLLQNAKVQDAVAWLLYYGPKARIVIAVADIENYPDWKSLVI